MSSSAQVGAPLAFLGAGHPLCHSGLVSRRTELNPVLWAQDKVGALGTG